MTISAQIREFSDNERVVLDVIWRYGPIARKKLAELTGLTGASATRLTKRAIELGLIEEIVDRDGAVGSPSRPLKRIPSGAYSIGVGFSDDSIGVALSNLDGQIIESQTRSIEKITINRLSDAIREFIAKSSLDKGDHSRLTGIGIAIPGYRSTQTGRWAVHWGFPDLLNIKIAEKIEDKVGLPVYTERDAIAAAWAERLNGAGRDSRSFCVLYLAQGVGGSLFVNGKPLMGAHGNAGGLGVLFDHDAPRPSAHDFNRHLARIDSSLADFNATRDDHLRCLDGWLAKVAPPLKSAFDIITRLYDPEKIILNGALPRMILERLVSAVDYRSVDTGYTAEITPPDICASEITETILLQGAAALPIAHFLSTNAALRWRS